MCFCDSVQDVVDSIVAADSLPLSIVFVGITDNQEKNKEAFEFLEYLHSGDGDDLDRRTKDGGKKLRLVHSNGHEAVRNIVSFTKYDPSNSTPRRFGDNITVELGAQIGAFFKEFGTALERLPLAPGYTSEMTSPKPDFPLKSVVPVDQKDAKNSNATVTEAPKLAPVTEQKPTPQVNASTESWDYTIVEPLMRFRS